MEHLVIGMKASIAELEAWQAANKDIPEVVERSIREYKNTMRNAIDSMQKVPFESGDRVELVSSSHEGGGYFSGDFGTVEDVRPSTRPSGYVEYDVLVSWDTSAADCWMPATDLLGTDQV
ncbi:hypothetical protein [Paenibacillus sp. 1A_MP2]|uniref:hypothetical protein n=1 Tax=Paenibacillus sp. 1A_MP2 TaxID=3457495 RepID=UPI003FCC80B2